MPWSASARSAAHGTRRVGEQVGLVGRLRRGGVGLQVLVAGCVIRGVELGVLAGQRGARRDAGLGVLAGQRGARREADRPRPLRIVVEDKLPAHDEIAGLAAAGQLPLVAVVAEQDLQSLGGDMRRDDPCIAEPRRATRTGAVRSGADPDGRAPWLYRREADLLLVQGEVLAVIAGRPARPKLADELDALLEPADPLVHPDSEGGELVLPVSHAEAGHGPAASQVVERGELLGHPDRVTQRQDEHVRPEPHVPRVGRERGKQRQWLQGRHVAQVVLQHPDRIDAGLCGRSYLLTQLGDPVGRHGARRKVVHDGQTELHGRLREPLFMLFIHMSFE